MKRNQHRFTVRPLVAAVHGALVILAVAPAAGADEITELTHPASSVEIGIGNVSQDSYKFGDYTGLYEKGVYGIANIDLYGGSYGVESTDPTRWHVEGTNLGLDSRSLAAEYGKQGKFRINLGYDELPKYRSDSYQTPFLGTGTSNLTLPAGWVASNTTAGMTQLNARMHNFDVKTERKKADVGFSVFLTPQWEFKASFKDERKDGTQLVGAVIGNSGGNPRAAILPEPIDTSTKQMEASFAYTSEKAQFQVGYYGSLFNNNITAFTWQNPYANATGNTWGNPAVGYGGNGAPGSGYGQYSESPDNQFHQINFMGGYNFSKTTRLTANASRGRMTQNEDFLPYTINSALLQSNPDGTVIPGRSASLTSALPRSSLNGEIITTTLNLKLTGRPMHGLYLAAAYKYDDKDNKTPSDLYRPALGDSQNQGSYAANGHVNLPESSTKHLISLDADYELRPRTYLKATYEWEKENRTNAEVDKTTENTYKLELRHAANERVSGTLRVAHAERKASGENNIWALAYPGAYAAVAGTPAAFDNIATKFLTADRDRDNVRATLSVEATDALSLQAVVDYNQDDYTNSTFGLQDAKTTAITLDASYRFSEAFAANAFYTNEDIRYTQNSRSYSGGAVKVAQANDPTRNWTANIADKADTIGLGFKHKGLLGGKLELGGDLTFSHVRTPISVSVGSSLSSAPLPDISSRSENLRLTGKYTIDKKSAVKLAYMYSHLKSTDWAYDAVAASTMANVIGTNEVSPNYNVHVIGASYIYTFR